MARPTEYREEFCGRVIEMGRKGKSKAQIAAGLDVSRQTLDNWAAVHPEFLDAVKAARDLALAWWEDQGQTGLTAEKFNATAFIFQVKNRFRDDYADRTAHELTGKNGGPIQTVDLSEATNDDLDRLDRLLGPIFGASAGGSDMGGGSGGEDPAQG